MNDELTTSLAELKRMVREYKRSIRNIPPCKKKLQYVSKSSIKKIYYKRVKK